MSVSAETYIVISLMFAVFAAVAAVGTSVVLGAGFERLRAGFEIVRKQSGFFADAIYKLDQRTQKLDEETAKIKNTVSNFGERIDRVEKTSSFLADGIQSIEQRILQGSAGQITPRTPVQVVSAVSTVDRSQQQPRVQQGWVGGRPQVREQRMAMSMDMPVQDNMAPSCQTPVGMDGVELETPESRKEGFTSLLASYFTGETSGRGRGVVYH